MMSGKKFHFWIKSLPYSYIQNEDAVTIDDQPNPS